MAQHVSAFTIAVEVAPIKRVIAGLLEEAKQIILHPISQALSVPLGLGLIYVALNQNWSRAAMQNDLVSTFVGQPMLWALIAGVVLFISWKGTYRLQFKLAMVPMAGLVGLFQLSILFIAGLLVGFGFSPYTRDIPAVFVNVVYFATAIIGMELARSYLLRVWRPKSTALSVISIGLLFAFISIPLSQLTSFNSGETAISFFGFRILPAAGEHLLTTYIALMGGPIAAITYRLILAAFEWLSPVLPDLPWAFSGLLGLIVPYIGFIAFRSIAEVGGRQARDAKSKKSTGTTSWLVLSFISTGIIWFGLGLFPYHPLAVNGDSMSPSTHRGDLVVLRKVEAADVTVGSVIQYRIGQFSILHRVIEVNELPSGERVYIAKGDANDIADPNPVTYGQIAGKTVFTIPKIGWVGLTATKVFSSITEFF